MFNQLKSIVIALRHDRRGASAVEYAILVGILGATLATGVDTFADGLSGVFTGLLAQLNLGAGG